MSKAPPEPEGFLAEIWDWPLQNSDGMVRVVNTKDKFEVGLEVQFFTPNEIEVKVCGEALLIHCRHNQKTEDQDGRGSREVHRAYRLPADVNPATLRSHLTGKGILVIAASKNNKS